MDAMPATEASRQGELPLGFENFLQEASDCPRPPLAAELSCGARLLGKGRTADVWDFGGRAIKLFRHRNGIRVPALMTAEIATYRRIHGDGSIMPALLAHGITGLPDTEAGLYGWAVLSKVAGDPLTFGIASELRGNAVERFVDDMAGQALRLEVLLQNAGRFEDWDDNYSDHRIGRMRRWYGEGVAMSADDIKIATQLSAFIQSERGARRYIHGDFNPPNILVDLAAVEIASPIVAFIDPMISRDAPESNWRHFTLLPDLADALLDAYARRSGTPGNARLMYAMGAFTHLYNAIAEPSQAVFRRPALMQCVRRADL